MKKILQKDDKVLRKIAKEVKISDITNSKTKTVIKEMFQSLAKEEDGVALAAPQIGYSQRIFVVSSKIFEDPKDAPLVYINPKIISISNDKKKMEEGCLSCRWLYGKTKRASRVEVEAYNEKGEKFQFFGTSLLAQIFQHEIDHLDGILFIDHAKHLKEVNPNDNE